MERLTDKIRNFDGTASSPKSLVIEEGMQKGMPSAYCSAIVTKLADYEDAEEQGLLLRLPYPLGTENLYFADNDDWYVLDARKMQAQKMPDGKILYEIDNFEFYEDDFGKIVFLTQEEAELELANRQQLHAEAIMDERNGR